MQEFVEKKDGDLGDPKVREAWGKRGAKVGIGVNVLLAVLKALVGVLTGSLAFAADAVNNISDAAGSLISLVSVKLANKPVDRQHPFGHGRMEYIGALAVGVLIIVAGVELVKSGVESVLNPFIPSASVWGTAILAASVLAKLFLYFYYRRIADRIDSAPMRASAKDSLSDVFVTLGVLVSSLLGHYLSLALDGWMALIVSVIVLKEGGEIVRDTVNLLLGEKPDAELVKRIKEHLLSYPEILGVHDLIVNDYGPGRRICSVHAEVAADSDFVAVHEVIDEAERDLEENLHLIVCIHMDPIETHDPLTVSLRAKMSEFVKTFHPETTIHDFRVVPGSKKTKLIFDVLLPFEVRTPEEEMRAALESYAASLDPKYELMVRFEEDMS